MKTTPPRSALTAIGARAWMNDPCKTAALSRRPRHDLADPGPGALRGGHVPQHQVWAFGARATGKAKPYSDLDLAIITDKPLPPATQAALADAFSASDLPWRVDIVDWSTTSQSFRKIIDRDKVVLR